MNCPAPSAPKRSTSNSGNEVEWYYGGGVAVSPGPGIGYRGGEGLPVQRRPGSGPWGGAPPLPSVPRKKDGSEY